MQRGGDEGEINAERVKHDTLEFKENFGNFQPGPYLLFWDSGTNADNHFCAAVLSEVFQDYGCMDK